MKRDGFNPGDDQGETQAVQPPRGRRSVHGHHSGFTKSEMTIEAFGTHNYIIKFGNGEWHQLVFQTGTIPDAGENGLTNEALIAVVVDRLRCFQSSPFSCRENALAITKLEEALHWLHERTRMRVLRGVEGTHSP